MSWGCKRLAPDSSRRTATVALKLTLHESYRVNPPPLPLVRSYPRTMRIWWIHDILDRASTCRMHIPTYATACSSRMKIDERRRKKTTKCILTYHRCCVLGGGAVCMKKKEAIDCGAKGDPGIALHEAGATGKRTNMAALCLCLSLLFLYSFHCVCFFFSIISLVTRAPS